MTIQLLAIMLSFSIFVFVLELVRREKLTFKYAFSWLFFAALGLFCSIFKEFLFAASRWCGFELPSNFIFFVLLCTFVFLSLLLTVFLCQQNSRNDVMAQKIALLELEMKELKKEIKGK